MRLTFILSSLHLSGGVRVVIQYSNRLVKRGHSVTIVVPNGTIDPGILAKIDSDIQVIQSQRSTRNLQNPLSLVSMAWSMARAVPASDLIIATHTPTTAVSFIAGKILRKGKNTWFYMDYQEMFDHRALEKWLLRHALRWHVSALAISEAGVQELQSFSRGRVSNIGLGLDIQQYHRIQNVSRLDYGDADKKAVFFLGDARPRKGMADFLAAMEIVVKSESNLVLWIASKDNADIVTSLPYKLFIRPTDEELARLYSICDVFVSASWYEGFGLPPLEAMACGAPVVTTDSRGIREFAIDGKNCLVVPIKDPGRMAEAIERLLSNPTLAEQFKQNGPLTAARFSWELATDRLETALVNCLNGKLT